MVRHKRRYWGCVDCGFEINDESMRYISGHRTDPDVPLYVEFCDVCNVYNPEVVMKYD